jgi:trehalose/maltose transport system substrate-binding protein
VRRGPGRARCLTGRGALRRLAAFALGLGLLGAADLAAGAQVTLAQFRQRESPAEAELLAQFERAHPGVRVRQLEMPASTDVQHQQYVTWLVAGDPGVDLYLIDVIWVAEFAAAGWLLPLDSFMPPPRRAAFFPSLLRATTYRGEIYALPRFTENGMLYYRSDLVSGPPATWDALVTAAAQHQRARLAGFVFQGLQYEGLVVNFLEHLWARGGRAFDAGGRPAFHGPAGVEALTFLVDLIHTRRVSPPGVTTYMERESLQEFLEGRAVFHRNWAYAWSQVQRDESKVRGHVGVAPLPGASGHAGAGALGGWNLALSRFSRHPREAWQLMEWLTSREAQRRKALGEGRIPTLPALYDDGEVLRVNPHFAVLKGALPQARPRPLSPFYPRLSGILQGYLSRALTQAMTPRDALDAAAAEVGRAVPRPFP